MNTKRLYFLDNLKWFIIWLMVVFHGAMCYMAYAPEWWYVVDKSQPVFSATLFICWVDIFIMPVMFFVSGYFGIMSLSRHNGKNFWQGKLRRIILPWLFGSAFIAPLIAYITLASRQSPMGFGEFYQNLFWGPFYQQANFWYLGALTVLYLMLHITVCLFPSLSQKSLPKHPSGLFFTLLMGLTVISIYFIGGIMPPIPGVTLPTFWSCSPCAFPPISSSSSLGLWPGSGAGSKLAATFPRLSAGHCPSSSSACSTFGRNFFSPTAVSVQKLWLSPTALPRASFP